MLKIEGAVQSPRKMGTRCLGEAGLPSNGMDFHGWIAVATLGVTVALFLSKRLPLGVVALGIPVVLVATGTLGDPSEGLAGFGSNAVVAIGSIFVIGAGLQECGVATLMARGLQKLAGPSETWLIVLVMLGTAMMSAFMNNAAAVALLLPAVVTLARRSMMPVSLLLMPLAFGAVLGGTVTMIGTAANLLVADSAQTLAGEKMGVFDFALVGIPIVVTGILYMAFVGRRLLPKRHVEDRLREARLPEEVAASYGLLENLFQMRVVPQSKVCGMTVADASLRTRYGLSLVMVVRQGSMGAQRYLHPRADLVLEPEDRLYLEGEEVGAWACAEEEVLQFGLAGPTTIERMLGRGMSLSEVTVPPRSRAIGKTIRDLKFRRRYQGNVLSLWRRGKPVKRDAMQTPLEVGDAFLVSGSQTGIRSLARDPDFIVLTDQSAVEDLSRAPLAIALLLVAILPPIVGFVPISISALAAALLMVTTGCLSWAGAERAIDWKVLALIVGTIPLGAALDQHGASEAVAQAVVGIAPTLGTPGVIAALFVMAALAATLSTNAAAAVILAPVAIKTAAASSIEPWVAILAVAYGCSAAFVLPFAQWNLLVMTPGGYTAKDFLRVGIGQTLVMAATVIVVLSLF